MTGSEREIINHHIVATIRMLNELPWPKHLGRVPEFTAAIMSAWMARATRKVLSATRCRYRRASWVLLIFFEALTAKDRPYKSGKTLSDSLFILGKFKENGHIDPDLFDLFIRERVYLRYAKKFL